MNVKGLRIPEGAPTQYQLASGIELPFLPEPLRIEIEHRHCAFVSEVAQIAIAINHGETLSAQVWRKASINTMVAIIQRWSSNEVLDAAASSPVHYAAHREIAAFLNLQLCAVILHGDPSPNDFSEARAIVWSTLHIQPLSPSMILTIERVYLKAGGYNQSN